MAAGPPWSPNTPPCSPPAPRRCNISAPSERDLRCGLEAAQDRLAAARAKIEQLSAEDAALAARYPRLHAEYSRTPSWPETVAAHRAQRGRLGAWIADQRELERRESAAVARAQAALDQHLAPAPTSVEEQVAAAVAALADARPAPKRKLFSR
ncbi:MAG: hypothetical protein ACKVWR_19160 [Acidimicrobiales bacterium]